MDMSFSFFLRQLTTNSALLITVLLTPRIICVNGIMDVPSTITTCVSARPLDMSLATAMAAICNCTGVVVMTAVNSMVIMAITNMVNLGEDTSIVLVALCAMPFPVVVWSSFTVSIGYPTSESHALIAGLTGAAVITHGRFSATNSAEWIEVVYDLISPVVLELLSGHPSYKLVTQTCRGIDHRKTTGFSRYAQIGGAAAMVFIHSTQDEQRFVGVMLLGICMVDGSSNAQGVRFPLWMLLLGSTVTALGTSVGGEKVIRSVGMGIVRLKKYQGFSTDMVGAACPLGFSIFGIPVSTTRTKVTAIMGVGTVERLLVINLSVAKNMVMTWVTIFLGYGITRFLMAKLSMMLFHE